MWNDALSACRIETLANDEKFTGCVDKAQAKVGDCVAYPLYAQAMTDEAWKWLEWPEKWDNGTSYIATVLGAANRTLDDGTVAEMCCTKVGGTYAPTVSTNVTKNVTTTEREKQSGKDRREEENRPGPGPDKHLVREGMYPPCLIPKAQDAAYGQCILDVEPSAFVMVASWTPYRNGTWVEDPGEKPDDAAGNVPSGKSTPTPSSTSGTASPSNSSSAGKLRSFAVITVMSIVLASVV